MSRAPETIEIVIPPGPYGDRLKDNLRRYRPTEQRPTLKTFGLFLDATSSSGLESRELIELLDIAENALTWHRKSLHLLPHQEARRPSFAVRRDELAVDKRLEALRALRAREDARRFELRISPKDKDRVPEGQKKIETILRGITLQPQRTYSRENIELLLTSESLTPELLDLTLSSVQIHLNDGWLPLGKLPPAPSQLNPR